MGDNINKITVATPFRLNPPMTGGQKRAFNLLKQLSRYVNVEVISFSMGYNEYLECDILDGFKEIRVPRSSKHEEEDQKVNAKARYAVNDVMLYNHYSLTPEYLKALKKSVDDSDIIISCHPFLYKAIRDVTDKPIWYEAQDYTLSLKREMYIGSPIKDELLSLVKKMESECVKDAKLIMPCSYEDAVGMSKEYCVPIDNFQVLPNGVEVSGCEYVPYSSRRGACKKTSIIFVGSNHGPNNKAVLDIAKLSVELPDVDFLVLGGCGFSYKGDLPSNLKLLGTVDDATKTRLLKEARFAINPMSYGSGTNLKMLEYFAYGVPVLTSFIGARGLDIEDGNQAYVESIDNFGDRLRHLLDAENSKIEIVSRNARLYVEQNFDWEVIVDNFVEAIKDRGYSLAKKRRLDDYRETEWLDTRALIKMLKDRDAYIWGCGFGGKSTLSYLKKEGIEVKGFIDSNEEKVGSLVEGLEVFGKEILSKCSLDNKPYIVIGSMYAKEISEVIETYGYIRHIDYFIQDIEVSMLWPVI